MWDLLIGQVAENLNDDPAYSSVGVQNQNLSSTKRYQKNQIFSLTNHKMYRLRRLYCGCWKVLIENIMACGIVGIPLEIAFDLETTPYIYFELPGDLSARGPAAWICAPGFVGTKISCRCTMSTVLTRTANRALLVCWGLGIGKTCRSCHLVVASTLNQDGNSPG